jgi:hypothetical protein
MGSEDRVDADGLGDEDEAALARLREVEARLLNTPPRCLEGFAVEPVTLNGVALDSHGTGLNKVYKLACACGHDRFRVLGHHLKNDRGEVVFVSPLALECAGCAKVTELIDTEQHGYDSELGHGSATMRGAGTRTPFACERCGVRPMIAYARFEHSGEDLADSFVEEFPNVQDYFSWFSLVGRCAGCGRMLNVADFECA